MGCFLEFLRTVITECVLLILTSLTVLLYPIIFIFLLLIYVYRYVVQKVVKRDPKFGSVLKGLDATLAAHNTYSPSTILSPVFYVKTTVDANQVEKCFMEKIIKPRSNNGQCLFPQLKQKIVRKLGYNWWYEVEDFDIKRHVRYYNEKNIKKAYTKKDVAEIVGQKLILEPFNLDLSPWEIVIVKNIDDEKDHATKSGIIFRCHHCLCDGYSVVKMMKIWASSPWKDLGGEMKPRTKIKNAWVRNAVKFLLLLFTTPYHVLKMMWFTNDKNEWVVKAVKEYSGFLRIRLVENLSLSSLKKVKDHHDVSLSSLITCLLADSIMKTLHRDNVNVDKIYFALPYPFPKHPPGKLTNHWSVAKLAVKVYKDDIVKTLKQIEKDYKKLRFSAAPLVGFYMSKIVGMLPIPMIPESEAIINCTCLFSNFPGPLHEVDVFGYKLTEIGSGASPPKGYAFSIAVLTYNGKLTFTLGGEVCNLKCQEDIDFVAKSLLENLETLQGNGQDKNIVVE